MAPQPPPLVFYLFRQRAPLNVSASNFDPGRHGPLPQIVSIPKSEVLTVFEKNFPNLAGSVDAGDFNPEEERLIAATFPDGDDVRVIGVSIDGVLTSEDLDFFDSLFATADMLGCTVCDSTDYFYQRLNGKSAAGVKVVIDGIRFFEPPIGSVRAMS